MKKILLAAFQLFLVSSFLFAQPANDICFNAIEIINLDNNCINFTIQDATNNITNGDCVNDADAANVWYKFTAQGNQLDITGDGPGANDVFVTLLTFNPVICVFESANQVLCGSGNGGGSIISYGDLVEGQQYYLVLNVENDDEGMAEFCINNPLVTPPENDDPCNPQVIEDNCVAINGTTIDAMYDIGITGPCAESSESGVFYEFTLSEGNNEVNIDVNNLSSGGNVTVILGTWPIDCNGTLNIIDIYCGSSASNVIEATGLEGGTSYVVYVGTSEEDQGSFDLKVCGQGPPDDCAQNDLCENVQFFPGVESGAGYVCVEGCNIGASPEPNLPGCNMSTEEVVWYRFTSDTEAALASINISSENIEDPTIQVFVGESCSSLTPKTDCVTGSNYSAQIINFYVQEQTVYWIAVSNAYGNGGDFNLCVLTLSNPSTCVLETNLEVVSTSLGSPLEGPFQPNEEVQFCYTINSYSSSGNNCQWLQGIIPIFGCAWSDDSFDENGMPISITTPLSTLYGGEWDWYTDVTYNFDTDLKSIGDFDGDGLQEICHYTEPDCENSGINSGDIMPPGWYHANPVDGPPDGHPNVDYGDGNACNTTMGAWTVCFTLKTNSESECGSCEDASVKMYTTADGETGSWNGGASICAQDAPQIFQAIMECCSAPVLDQPLTQMICSGETSFLELKSNNGDPSISYTYSPLPNTSISGAMDGEGAFITQTLINSSTEMATQIYQVIATDESGCESSPLQVSIDVFPPIIVDAGMDQQACESGIFELGGSPTATGGGGEPFTYEWSNPSFGNFPNPTASPTLSTTYVVTVTDLNGCMNTDYVQISINQPIQIEINGNTSVCQSGTLELSVVVTGGAPNYSYNWEGSGISGNTSELMVDASTLEIGTIQIVLTVSDVNGCVSTEVISVEVLPNPEIIFVPSSLFLCTNESLTLEANVSPVSNNYTYQWNGPEGMMEGESITVMTAGEYTLTLLDDSTGCSAVNSVIVNESADYSSLLALYNSTDGANWTINTGWIDGVNGENCNPCDGWYGVTCDGNGRVIEIDLTSNNLVGTIPSEIQEISMLQELNLAQNSITGGIPEEIVELSDLTSLLMNNNDLSGCIEESVLEKLCSLDTKDLSGNPLLPWEGNTNTLCMNESSDQVGAPCNLNGEEGEINEDCTCEPSTGMPHLDCAPLSAFYNSTGGANWTNNTGWIDGVNGENCNPCDGWYGVTCDGNGRVIEIDLSSNNLVGTIPSDIKDISMLQEFNLAQNSISGNIPEEIVELTNLTSLLMNNNDLSGCIEESVLEKLCSLDTKDLSGNPLLPWEGNTNTLCMNESSDQVGAPCNINGEEGEINEDCTCEPSTGMPHPDCAPLSAFYNGTGGANWTNNTGWSDGVGSENCNPCDGWYGVTCDGNDRVIEINLASNNLVGTIPSEIQEITMLEQLNLAQNGMIGSIPEEIVELTNLTSLLMNNNDLSGCIDESVLEKICSLDTKDLSGNPLLPWEGNTNTLCMNESSDQVGAPCNLNGEEGEIDEDCDCIPNSGAVHLDCAPLMAFYSNTGGVNWTNNTGWSDGADSTNCDPCDGWYGVTCNEQGRVTELILEANNLEGIIPSEISKLTKLTNISLSANLLTGEVPSSMGSLKKLKNLSLSKNNLFGNIPKELGQLSELTALSLNNNQFSGSIPAELGDLAVLNVMDLSSNSLIGEIPSSLGDLKEITKLYLHDNYLLGCYDANLMELCDVGDLDFTNNPLLPWEGDFEKFCATDGSEAAQEDAPCDDGNPDNGMEDKIVDCVCTGNVSTYEENVKELIFFPNPVNNQIYIKGLESGKYRMIDLYGRTVVNGHFRHSINVAELMEGMYILQVYNGQHWHTGAIQILRTE